MPFQDCHDNDEVFLVEEGKKNVGDDDDDDDNDNDNDDRDGDEYEDDSPNTSGTSIDFYPSVIESIIEEDADDEDNDDMNNNTSSNSIPFSSSNYNRIGSDYDKNKIVKFADDEAEKHDARRDMDRSRQELLSKIARLTDVLKDVQNQVQVEKNKRKKKEESLLKLGKELRKRNSRKKKDEDRTEELEEKKKYLEHRWVLAQKELDQEKDLHTKLQEESQGEYELSVKDEKNKYERTVQENENRLADLKKSHREQCDDLGQDILRANLEADRLYNELTARGLNISRRSLFKKVENKRKIVGFRWRTFISVLIIFSGMIYFVLENNLEIFTMSGCCTPVMPGTTLDDNSYGFFQAPWWAPSLLKQQVFTIFCADKATDNHGIPSSIEWTRDGKNNKLAISVQGEIVLKKSIAKTHIASHKIQLWKRNGHVDDISFNWSLLEEQNNKDTQ